MSKAPKRVIIDNVTHSTTICLSYCRLHNFNNHSKTFSLVSKSHEDCVGPGGRPGPMTEHQSVQYKINDKINYKSRPSQQKLRSRHLSISGTMAQWGGGGL